MNQNDLISVIIPVFNVEQYISQCLDSILASTYRSLEVICINDASTDKSLEILIQYKKKDDRIILVNCQKNGGQATARNKGIDIAKGSYIAFVDSDDYVAPNFFESLYRKIKKDQTDISVCGFYIQETNEKRTEETISVKRTILTEKEWWEAYRHKHSVFSNCVWNKLYKADCFKENRFVSGKIYEDTEIQHNLISNRIISVIPDCLYYYRKRDDSTTASIQKHNKKSFLRVEALLGRAAYFSQKKWELAKVNALQDAIKFLYHSIYESDIEITTVKNIGYTYRHKIRKMLNVYDWMTIKQKVQCFMILYTPDFYNLLRMRVRQLLKR